MTAPIPRAVLIQASTPQPAATTVRPLLRLAGISKTFGNGVAAVAGIDLTVRPGEFVSLLGPSGCGKSTLLNLIARLIMPSAGSIDWPRSVHDAYGRPEPALGFVFQEPTLLPWRTVADNVRLPLMLARVDRHESRRRVEDALALVGLSSVANLHPRQLSGGMKMRVSIARALVMRPQILLMDEPFAALDEITRGKLNDDLLRLYSQQSLTVIFVTHSVYESVYLSSRIVVMSTHPGRISAEVPVDVAYPRNEEYRTSTHYNERCRLVSAALRTAMTPSHPGRA